MSGRLGDVETSIDSVRQLSSVVTAMRSIAAVRAREARARIDGVRSYAATISTAIADVLGLQDYASTEPANPTRGAHAVVALCAEQGFAGNFSERVLEAAAACTTGHEDQPRQLLIVGSRGVSAAREHAVSLDWSTPMIAHASQASELANRLSGALYDRLASASITHVTLVYAALRQGTAEILPVAHPLLPFDFRRFQPHSSRLPPIFNLPLQTLLARLAEEYVFAELCEAVLLSFAAENEARMRAMTAAHTHVGERLQDLVALSRRLRQEEITSEIVELSSGMLAACRRVG